jgi:predicted acyltransferase
MGHNVSNYVDRVVLGRHNWSETKTFDPEGLISTLPAIATTLFGIMAGHILHIRSSLAERTVWLFIAGTALIVAGLISNIWLPINKKIWTDSFALFMAGLDFVVLAVFVWVVDGLGYRRIVKPLVIMGMNAIAIYVLAEICEGVLDATSCHDWLYGIFSRVASPMNASLLYAIIIVLLMYGIAYGFYRRRWFVKV